MSNLEMPKAVTFMDLEEVGDAGPEGLRFLAAKNWLVVTSEVSSPVSVYEISVSE
ncbi:hypothetical protein ACQUQP_03350 [Marinobacterium sp. YM272]|uniref:hypothetical protein n=1 Tax=Marinobacterium sp. YM272 TaxID=3421654 RepID=UPI003D7FD8CF